MQLTLKQAFQKGVEAHKLGRIQEADRFYTAVLDADPTHADANHNLGLLGLTVNKIADALPFFERALKGNAQVEQFWLSYIEALVALSRYDKAMIAIDAAKLHVDGSKRLREVEKKLSTVIQQSEDPLNNEVDPPLFDTQNLVDLYSDKQFDVALVHATKLATKYPKSSLVQNILGVLYHISGEPVKAIDALQNSIDLDPRYAEAYNNLGNTWRAQQSFEKALAAYENAMKFNPKSSEIHNNLGVTLIGLRRYEAAHLVLSKSLEIDDQNSVAFYNIGKCLVELNNIDGAKSAFKKAIELNSGGNSDAYKNLGIIYDEAGQQKKAVESFQKSFAIRSGIHPTLNTSLSAATTSVFFELTNKCNFHCTFCPSDLQTRRIGSMDFELVKKLYDETAEKNLTDIVNLHLMGEPTLHPQLISILDYAASKNIKTDLVTNGSTLVPKTVPKILGSLYGVLTASHMTPTKNSYQFRGKVGLSWERYISNLKLLVRSYLELIKSEERPKCIVNIRVMSSKNTASNVEVLSTDDEARLILKEWSDFVSEIEQELELVPFNRKCHKAKDLLRENSQKSISYALQDGLNLVFWKAFTFANTRVSDDFQLEEESHSSFCSHPFTDVGVLWNGDVTLCCLDHDGELAVGNISDKSIEDIVVGESAQKLRASMLGQEKLPPLCKKCQARPVPKF